jgi:hypothetical protein
VADRKARLTGRRGRQEGEVDRKARSTGRRGRQEGEVDRKAGKEEGREVDRKAGRKSGRIAGRLVDNKKCSHTKTDMQPACQPLIQQADIL